MKSRLAFSSWSVFALGLGLLLLSSGLASAQTSCDQCSACKPAPSWAPAGSPPDCTARDACLAVCTATNVVNDLDTLRRQALDRLGKDEKNAADRVQAELDAQLADVTTKATAARVASEQLLTDASGLVRTQVTVDADAMQAAQRKTVAALTAAGPQLKTVEACFGTPIPKVVLNAYRDALTWGRQGLSNEDNARNAALAAVSAGLTNAKAEAARVFAAPVAQLAALSSPVQSVHDAAARIKNSLQSLSDLDALRSDASDGFQELQNLGDSGVSSVRDAGRTANATIQSLSQGAAERTRLAGNQWLTQARAALAAAAPGDPTHAVPSLAKLRSSLRKATSAWPQLLSCLCTNVDVLPPADPKDPSVLGDAVCIRPVLEAPYSVVLADYKAKRSVGGQFDYHAFARAAAHVAGMPTAHLVVRAASSSGAPGTLGQALTANPAWQFVGPTNLDTPYTQYYGNGPVAGRVNALAYDPHNTNHIFAGSAAGAVIESAEDAGMPAFPVQSVAGNSSIVAAEDRTIWNKR
jgi:hypothetical protein